MAGVSVSSRGTDATAFCNLGVADRVCSQQIEIEIGADEFEITFHMVRSVRRAVPRNA